ncbi:hypothetical protein BDQ17DRAFT_1413760 [Cyathus striatus]|nr:hypothetical protein BDQ17DRAFT_1413760 [Cyathus striatus]
MAHRSTRSAITQASSILPTESAPPSATYETHTESCKHGTSAADLTAQSPTKKANIPISDEEEAENVKEKQVKKVKKIVKDKKGKKTQKTSEMKAAEDAATDAESVPDLTVAERVLEESGLPVAPPKQGPPLNVPQPAAPAFTVTRKHHSDMEKLKKKVNLMDLKPVMKVKVKKKHLQSWVRMEIYVHHMITVAQNVHSLAEKPKTHHHMRVQQLNSSN